ncbi:Imm61 family immunity protein [Mycolicibacterium pallens]|uniref:TNT antitoxin family protein n=1 Tax=Mycolicibacterium pallens TaxID=370524 RepID=A0ABX8VKM7_9MYCO|nr:Imm61 family immunity protein [Mycolicibacterium pallens]QYL18358.1 TNT antitoxin family protein [Mycolicibacterium pallens]
MRPEIGLTSAFERWAHRAGFQITESSSTDGRAIVWDGGGEIRYFFGVDADGWIVATCSERMGKEQFELASTLPSLVERKFITDFARPIRSLNALRRLAHPRTAEDVAAGYSIGRQHYWGKNRCTLVDPENRVVAVVGGGELVGTMKVAYLSVLASNTVEAIEQSFLDPEGKPVFSVRDD